MADQAQEHAQRYFALGKRWMRYDDGNMPTIAYSSQRQTLLCLGAIFGSLNLHQEKESTQAMNIPGQQGYCLCLGHIKQQFPAILYPRLQE